MAASWSRAAVAITLSLGWTASASAAGFAIREQSASSQGVAFAGIAAGGNDVSAMFFNPAALSLYGSQSVANFNAIAPKAQFRNGKAQTISLGAAGAAPIRGQSPDNIGNTAFVPALYGSYAFEDWRFGLGVTAPFGLESEAPDDWLGRYHATTSELRTININPSLAYQAHPYLSLGAGVVVQYAKANLQNAIDFGTIGAVGAATNPALASAFAQQGITPQPTAQDGLATAEGDDWDFGFTLGFLITPPTGTRIGVGYRSPINHSLSGDGEFRQDGAGVAQTLTAATGAFVNSGISASTTLPQSVSVGIAQKITEQWEVLGTFEWTDWSSFDELLIRFDNPAQPASLTEQDWSDSIFVSAGVQYRPIETLQLQAGVAWDQTPIPDSTRTPRIPGSSRTWLSIGANWRALENVTVGIGYSHIFVQDGDVDLSATDPGNTFRGDLSGTFENQIDIFALSAAIEF